MKKGQLIKGEMIIDYGEQLWVKPRRGEMIIENGYKPFRQTPKGWQIAFMRSSMRSAVTPSGFYAVSFLFSIIMPSLRDSMSANISNNLIHE